MTEHLWPYLRLKAPSDEELKEAYRRVFIESYVRTSDGKEIEIFDWMGNRVLFNPRTFEHAFSESTDYRFGDGSHDVPFSKKRARCILWIKEVLAASKGRIERRVQLRQDSRGKLRKRRALIVVEERYVVVLEERKEPNLLEFITAFPSDENYLKKIRRESGLIEIKNPSLNGD
ncbi:MAG: hypothetical protein A4E66_01617 [Syntrophus sp. PtaB.Bin001]|nr:MAG: hypothetical protein A4E66_01617 [Syntrophus sp. PtaB.Bin001]